MLDFIHQTHKSQLGFAQQNDFRFAALFPKLWCAIALTGFAMATPAQTLSEVVNQALQTYPAILSSSAKTAAARADIGRARSAHYPQLGITAATNTTSSGVLPSTTQRTSLSPTARLNLWSGGKIEAEAERAEALTRSSESVQASTLDDIAQKAAEAYLSWARATDLHALASKNVSSHRETLDDLQKIVNVDKGRRVDYEQALVRMENANLALQQRKADVDQARQVVRRFWTAPLKDKPADLSAEVSDTGLLGRIPPSLPLAIEMITDDLPSIAQYAAQVQAAQAAVRIAKGQFWPTVDVTVSRQANTATSDLRQDTFTQLQLNAPLYNGGANTAGLQGALSQVNAAKFALDEARILAREKAALAWQEWDSAKLRASTGSSQSDVGDKLVEAYRMQFRVARRSLLDLLNIQAESFNYRSAALNAFHDERVARVRLLAATGDLARRFAFDPGQVNALAR
jgi:outer membrane protein, adhesin transport system